MISNRALSTYVHSVSGAYVDAGHELQEALQVRFHGDFMACKWLFNGGMMGIYLGYVCMCIYIHTYRTMPPRPAKQKYIVDFDQFNDGM